MFYNEYKHWVNNQDFSDLYFNQNKEFLFDKLEYLRLHILFCTKTKIWIIIRYY